MHMVKKSGRSVPKKPAAQTSAHTKVAARRNLLRQLAGYTLSGGARFWSGYGAFFVFDAIFGMHLWWAKQLANVIGLAVEFTLNRYFVFTGKKQKNESARVSLRFIAITLVNFVIDYYIILGLKHLGVSPYIGQFVSAGFFWGWNFMWYRFWVFTGAGSRTG